MASQKLFEGIPPFPENIPTATVPIISLKKLNGGDGNTAKAMLDACQRLGFFMLDLRGDDLGSLMISDVDEVFGAAKEIYDLPSEVKKQYKHDPPRSFLGFKAQGSAFTETKEPDRFQWFNIAQDGLLGNMPLQPLPEAVLAYRTLFTSFLTHGRTIVSKICVTLAEQLFLPPSTFTDRQPLDKTSGTVIRLIKNDASSTNLDMRTSMVHHTDFGSVTLLANILGGLQILIPGKAATDDNAWLWVRPIPGHMIVNLGDAIVQWTGGLLRSNVHRVRYAPGPQRFVERYSVGLLVRPEENASMKSVMANEGEQDHHHEDEGLTARQWEIKQLMALQRGANGAESKGGRKLTTEEIASLQADG